jgi:tetratricopeptide (TPR) repeat protein
MVSQPTNLSPEHEETYDELISLIENSQGRFSPIIVACDGLPLRQRIIDRYEAEAWETERIRPSRVRLGQDPSLRAALASLLDAQSYLMQAGKAVVTVTGAEMLLRVKMRSADEQTEVEQFFGYLQWTREGLREFRYPVVLWVSSRILREMSRRAPDFWSWRKAVLRFVDADSVPLMGVSMDGVRVGSIVLGGDEADSGELPPLAELIAEIEEMVKRNPWGAGVATLYGRLGEIYAERVRRGVASAVTEGSQAVGAFCQAIDRYQAQGNSAALAATLNQLAGFYDEQSQFIKALQTAQSALEAANQSGNQLEAMIAWRRLGNAEQSLGNYPQAIAHQEQSLKIAREIDDKEGIAASLGNLGNEYYFLGDYQRAIELQSQSLEIERAIGNQKGIAYSLTSLGIAYDSLGDYQRAIELYSQSLEINQRIGDRQGIADSFSNLGIAYQSLGNAQRSIDFQSQSLSINQAVGNQQGIGHSLRCLGSSYDFLGDYQRAIELYSQSLEIQQAIGDKQGIAASLGNLGSSYNCLGEYQRAIEFQSQSVELAEVIGDRHVNANAHFNLALAQANLDDHWAAKQNYGQAKIIFTDLKLDHMVKKCIEAIRECDTVIAAIPIKVPTLDDP